MLRDVELSKKIDKEEYDKLIPDMRLKLGALQRDLNKSKIPVMLVFEGWHASGKSLMVNEILRAMDPRCFQMHAIDEPTPEEAQKPFMWRFWMKTPPSGLTAIFDQGWYSRFIEEKADIDGKKMLLTSRKEQEAISQIFEFEKVLATGGGSEQSNPYLILKFFLDISKKEQKKRLEKLEDRKVSVFLVNKADWKQHKHYGRYMPVFDRMIELTDAIYAPWKIVEADNWRFATVKVYVTIIDAFNKGLQQAKKVQAKGKKMATMTPVEKEMTGSILDKIDLNKSMPEDEYHERLKTCQKELAELQMRAFEKKLPVVIAYEGMDASGKGGNIKRLSESLDPRGYEVIPIGVPTDVEKNHHYLWRFWIHFPSKGYFTIFDRTWYGRVLVERVEGLTSEKYWRKAYNEINRMEEALSDNGTVVIKFWLQIDPKTELERFKSRETNPNKEWKIDINDWKDRSKWNQYTIAADEMLYHTSTTHAPWHIIPSDDKHYSRITTMDTIIDTIKKAL
jgi:polyphosphate:AMP phosphotransferase